MDCDSLLKVRGSSGFLVLGSAPDQVERGEGGILFFYAGIFC